MLCGVCCSVSHVVWCVLQCVAHLCRTCCSVSHIVWCVLQCVAHLIASLFWRVSTRDTCWNRNTIIHNNGRSGMGMLQCVAVCCSVLQCVAVCCSVLQTRSSATMAAVEWVCCSVLQCVAVSCSVLQYLVVCCSVLQCVAGSCKHDHLQRRP